MSVMLKPPSRPLPRKFNRHVSGSTRAFVNRRHKRHKQYSREKILRVARRSRHVFFSGVGSLRKWLWLILAGGVVAACAFFLFSPSLRVQEIRLQNRDARLNTEHIMKSLEPIFGRQLVFVSSREIQIRIQDSVPDVQDVTITKHYPSELSIGITLHPLIAHLIIENPDGTVAHAAAPASGSGQQVNQDYLTDNGLYVSVPSAASGAVLPVIHVVDWAVLPVPSTPLFSMDLLQRMSQAEQLLQQQFAAKITGRTVFIRAREFHFSLPQFSLWFDMSSPLADQVQRYRIFLKNVAQAQVHHYVDLRLTGRIVYR